MLIQKRQPTIVPAIPETIYDGFWASKITISAPTPQSKASAIIELKPYNAQSKQILNTSEILVVEDLWQEAFTKVKVAQAVEALLDAINLLKTEKDTPPPAPEPEA